MLTILTDPTQNADYFKQAYEDPDAPVDWESVYEGYTAAVDWPTAAFYEPLLARYPTAKVILTVRDPDLWYESAGRTIREWPLSPDKVWPEHILKAQRMASTVVQQGELEGPRFVERERIIEKYLKHNAHVIATVPSDQLLVLDVTTESDDMLWRKLAAFLNIPRVPDIPFPHKNKANGFPALLEYARLEYAKNELLLSTKLTNPIKIVL